MRERPVWLRGAATIEGIAEAEADDGNELGNIEIEVGPFGIPVAHDPIGWEVSARREELAATA